MNDVELASANPVAEDAPEQVLEVVVDEALAGRRGREARRFATAQERGQAPHRARDPFGVERAEVFPLAPAGAQDRFAVAHLGDEVDIGDIAQRAHLIPADKRDADPLGIRALGDREHAQSLGLHRLVHSLRRPPVTAACRHARLERGRPWDRSRFAARLRRSEEPHSEVRWGLAAAAPDAASERAAP